MEEHYNLIEEPSLVRPSILLLIQMIFYKLPPSALLFPHRLVKDIANDDP